MPRETLGGRIERLRGLTELSARELDGLAGLRFGHTRLIETGHVKDVNSATLSSIAEVFGITLDWLYSGTGPAPDETALARCVAAAKRRAGKTGTAD